MHERLRFSDEVIVDGVKEEGNVILAVIAGLVASVLGAVLWFSVTLATATHWGLMALAVGALVGLAIRFAGGGTSPLFGLLGAVYTLLSCLAGEVMVAIQFSTSNQMDFYAVLVRTDLAQLVSNLAMQTSPLMYLIYGIAIFEGYRLSIR
jgi:hypothetical protein